MGTAANDPLFTALSKSGQLSEEQLEIAERIWLECADDLQRLAGSLRNSNLVSIYQFRKIQIGRAGDLLFGKYLIFDKIGEGGMGKVYRAADTNLSRLVALKVVRPSLLANKTVLMRYRREAQATATLDHPNIVHLYDADESNGRHYMAMEYVDGSDLARLVKQTGPLSSVEACEYIRQAALGLHHAHEKGFIHRDIKPSNLLVYGERALEGSSGKAMLKILDMGLVRSLTEDEGDSLADLTRDNTVVGTPDFMSPEQASDSRSVDGRADLYSLGCALVYLLKGKPPYQETSTIAKLLAHQRDPIPDVGAIRADIPEGVAEIAKKLMAKKREDRFQTGAEVAAALMPFTPEGSRHIMHAPAAVPRAVAKTLGGATATVAPVFENFAAPTPSPFALGQEIARPNVDLQSSPSVELDDADAEPIRSKRRRRGFPLWLAVSLALLCIGLPVATWAIFSRSKPTESSSPTIVKKTAPSPTKPAEPVIPHYRPMRELLPSDTAAILVYFPKPYWDAESPNLPRGIRATLDALTKNYGFDPRWFERGVVAFQKNGVKCVASGEAAALNAEWLAEFEKVKGRVVGPADMIGIRPVRYNRVNAFVPKPKEDKVIGAVLPPVNGIGGVLLSDSQLEMNALMNHLAAKVQPSNVSEAMLDTAVRVARTHPHAFFAASGDFEVPRTGQADPPSLGTYGINLFTATFHYDQKWNVEIDIAGPDEKKLRHFYEVVLPKCFDNSSAAAAMMAKRIRTVKEPRPIVAEGGEKHLKASFVWENAAVCAVIEQFLTK
jgi:serine/threonine-protein kinase